MIDTHAHIDTLPFAEDIDDVVEQARRNGIHTIIIPDIKPSDRPNLIQVVNRFPNLFRGIGVHPHHTAEVDEGELAIIERDCKQGKVVAIGEIGLDYYYDFSPPAVQKLYFREQIRIAKRNDLPIIVHNRDSDQDVMSIIEEEQDGTLRGVLHCFSGDMDILTRAMELGMHVSFTGNITFKKSTLAPVIEAVDSDRYMIETDSPYITPEPNRGKRNEPQFVRFIAQKISEIRGETVDKVIENTTTNARKLFGLTMMLLFMCVSAYAQPQKPDFDDYDSEREYDLVLESYYADSAAWSRWIKPRTLGFGVSIGSNTVVEQQVFTQNYDPTFSPTIPQTDPRRWTTSPPTKLPERSFSFDGLTSFGGTITYGLTTRLVLEGTYMYTSNTQPAKEFGLDPIVTNVVELTANYSLNPYSKVNFVTFVGGTFAGTDNGVAITSKFGVNAGLGLGMNIPTSFGLFYPIFNVRFNFMFGADKGRIVQIFTDPSTGEKYTNSANPAQQSEIVADVTTIYSIPRLTILFYPNL